MTPVDLFLWIIGTTFVFCLGMAIACAVREGWSSWK